MNEFDIINETKDSLPEINELNNVVNFALEYMKVNNSIFNIIIVDEEKIHKLNKTYRGIDRATDVISFALEDDDTFIKTDFRVLGDIYICLSKAREQATNYGHSFVREISFLTVHGLLHLLGYDHIKKADEAIMFELQERILSEYGIKR